MMDNHDILFHLDMRIDHSSRVGLEWEIASLFDIPPSLRDWAADELVKMMKETNSPAYVWKVRE